MRRRGVPCHTTQIFVTWVTTAPFILSPKTQEVDLLYSSLPSFLTSQLPRLRLPNMEATQFSSQKEEPIPTRKSVGTRRISASSSKANKGTRHESCSLNLGQHVADDCEKNKEVLQKESYGRERLKRHREEVAGRIAIPETWGQEDLLQDWIDCSSFDKLLAPNGISSAREALIVEGRRAASQRLRVESRC